MTENHPYPYKCVLCGVVWNRQDGEPPPPPDAPHNHTTADWMAYHDLNGSGAPVWVQIPGVEYPPLPPWPSEIPRP